MNLRSLRTYYRGALHSIVLEVLEDISGVTSWCLVLTCNLQMTNVLLYLAISYCESWIYKIGSEHHIAPHTRPWFLVVQYPMMC